MSDENIRWVSRTGWTTRPFIRPRWLQRFFGNDRWIVYDHLNKFVGDFSEDYAKLIVAAVNRAHLYEDYVLDRYDRLVHWKHRPEAHQTSCITAVHGDSEPCGECIVCMFAKALEGRECIQQLFYGAEPCLVSQPNPCPVCRLQET